MKTYKYSDLSKADINQLILRNPDTKNEIRSKVEEIIDEVKKNGDSALKSFAQKFDGECHFHKTQHVFYGAQPAARLRQLGHKAREHGKQCKWHSQRQTKPYHAHYQVVLAAFAGNSAY